MAADSFDRAALVAELTRDEGRLRSPYRDTMGKETIGVGHNLTAKPISDAAVDQILSDDIDDAVTALDHLEPQWRTLDPDRQRVLLNMMFNLGPATFAQFHRFWAAIEGYLHDGALSHLQVAAAEMLSSTWATQVGDRAKRLARRMLGPPVAPPQDVA